MVDYRPMSMPAWDISAVRINDGGQLVTMNSVRIQACKKNEFISRWSRNRTWYVRICAVEILLQMIRRPNLLSLYKSVRMNDDKPGW